MVEVDKFNLIENDSAVSEKFKDKNFFPVAMFYAMSFIRNVLVNIFFKIFFEVFLEDNTFITEYEDYFMKMTDHKEGVRQSYLLWPREADGRVIQIPKPKLDLESRLVQKQNIFSPVSY